MKEIIAEYGGLIRSVIKKITGSYNEDIEQEVYIKTWKNMENYQEQGKFSSWLSTLTANVCRDYFKSKQHIMETKQVSGEEILDKVKFGGRQEEVIDAKKRQKRREIAISKKILTFYKRNVQEKWKKHIDRAGFLC